jgi:hypothetical protein
MRTHRLFFWNKLNLLICILLRLLIASIIQQEHSLLHRKPDNSLTAFPSSQPKQYSLLTSSEIATKLIFRSLLFFVYLYIKWHERIILDDCMWMMPHNNKDVNLIALFEWLLFAREMLNERRTSTQFSLFTRYYLYFHPLYVGIAYFGL